MENSTWKWTGPHMQWKEPLMGCTKWELVYWWIFVC